MNVAQVKRACMAEIDRAYNIVEAEYGITIDRPPVRWSNRLKKSGGYAQYKKLCGEVRATKIELSESIMRLNPDVFVEDVPAHEAMHVAHLQIFGYEDTKELGGHNHNWRGLMRLVDRCTSRTHSMKTVDNRVKAYCKCDGFMKISKQRAGKIRKRTASYSCKRCKGTLTLRVMRPLQIKEVQHIPPPAPRAQPRGFYTPPPKMEEVVPPKEECAVAKTKSGVNAVVAILRVLKKQGIELTMILEDATVLSGIAARAQVTGAECRQMIRSNWSRV